MSECAVRWPLWSVWVLSELALGCAPLFVALTVAASCFVHALLASVSGPGSGLKTGAILGIVFGCVGGVAVVAVRETEICFWLWRLVLCDASCLRCAQPSACRSFHPSFVVSSPVSVRTCIIQGLCLLRLRRSRSQPRFGEDGSGNVFVKLQ